MENKTRETAHNIEKAAETMGNTAIAVIDKLAGKKSEIKLNFQDLTLDVGMMKARLNGAVVLEVVFAEEPEK